MSLLQMVVDEIRKQGRASVNELHFEGTTRRQVQKAIQNATQRRLIVAVQHRQRGQNKGRMGSIYTVTNVQPPRGDYNIPRISSVWELGGQHGAQT